jgi:RHS repeat-associated protein
MPQSHPPHYPPFGSSLPNRSWSDGNRGYRFGFNGKEKDSETASDNFDFGARIYDGRLGRWLSVDPLGKKYCELSQYLISINSPIVFLDFDGRDFIISNSLFNNIALYQTYFKISTNYIIISLITKIKEDIEITAISPMDDPSNENICQEDINTNYDAYYSFKSKKINFNPLQSALLNENNFLSAFVHELMHKRIDQVFSLIIDKNNQIVATYSPEYENYVAILKEFGPLSVDICHHEYIARFGREEISKALKFNNMENGVLKDKSGNITEITKNETTGGTNEKTYNWTSEQWYDALSWAGLTNTKEFTKLSADTQELYKKIIENERPKLSGGIKAKRK